MVQACRVYKRSKSTEHLMFYEANAFFAFTFWMLLSITKLILFFASVLILKQSEIKARSNLHNINYTIVFFTIKILASSPVIRGFFLSSSPCGNDCAKCSHPLFASNKSNTLYPKNEAVCCAILYYASTSINK